MKDSEYVHMGLRRTLALIGIPMHAEILAGLSYRGYLALDVYRSFWSVGMPLEPVMASHYVVYSTDDVASRWQLRPDEWYCAQV